MYNIGYRNFPVLLELRRKLTKLVRMVTQWVLYQKICQNQLKNWQGKQEGITYTGPI
jgi:hypothetical protein